MGYEIEIKDLPPRAVATVRTTIAPDGIAGAFDRLLPDVMAHIQAHGERPAGPPLAIFHRYEPDGVDMEVGFALPLQGAVPSEPPVEVHELPAGRAAVTWHHGPYSKLGEAHRAVTEWIAAEGHKEAGPPWELYWSNPSETPAAELRTEVGYPIE
jgi:effector-binding domain-containing protein